MISIENYTDRIVICGHAGAAVHGESVPCEAVTVLCNTLAGSLRELAAADPEYVIRSGYFYISKESLDEHGALLIRAFLLGLRMVAEAYPEYINFSDMTEH